MPSPASLNMLHSNGFRCESNQWVHPNGRVLQEQDIKSAEERSGPPAVQAMIRSVLGAPEPPPPPPAPPILAEGIGVQPQAAPTPPPEPYRLTDPTPEGQEIAKALEELNAAVDKGVADQALAESLSDLPAEADEKELVGAPEVMPSVSASGSNVPPLEVKAHPRDFVLPVDPPAEEEEILELQLSGGEDVQAIADAAVQAYETRKALMETRGFVLHAAGDRGVWIHKVKAKATLLDSVARIYSGDLKQWGNFLDAIIGV